MNKDFEHENEIHEEDQFVEYDDEQEDFKEIILTLDDDTELTCLVIAQYQVENQDYIALLPIEDEEPGDILLYRASYSDDETFDVSLIEDEKEFEMASEAYYDFIDENEIDLEDFHHHDHHHHDHDHDHSHYHEYDEYDEYEEDYDEYDDGYEVDYLDEDENFEE